MAKKFFTLAVFMIAVTASSAQGWLGKLKDKAVDKARVPMCPLPTTALRLAVQRTDA